MKTKSKIIILFILNFHSILYGQKSETSKVLSQNELTTKEIYDFIQVVIAEQKLNKNHKLDITPPTHCSITDNDSIFLMQFLIDTSKIKEDNSFSTYDSISGKYKPHLSEQTFSFPIRPQILTLDDINFMLLQNRQLVNFKWDNNRLNFNQSVSKAWYEISLPMFSKDKTKVIIRVSDLCPGLCGNGNIYLFVKKGNEWDIMTISSWFH
jgi:hypothetical protein